MARFLLWRAVGVILSSAPAASIAAPPPVEWAKIVGQSVPGRPVICYDAATDAQNNIVIATGANWGVATYSPTGDFLSRSGLALNDFTRIDEVRCLVIADDGAVNFGGNNESGAFSPWGTARFAYAGHRPIAIGRDGSSLFAVTFGGSNDMIYGGASYSSTGYYDAIIFRAGPSGNWTRRVTGSMDEYIDSMAFADNGDAVISIGTSSTPIGIAGLSLNGTHHLVSLDPQGNPN